MSVCRGCGAPINWIKTTEGRNMPIDPEPVLIIEGGGTDRFVTDEGAVVLGRVARPDEAGPRRQRERKCNRMEAQVMTSKMQERKAEAAEFLIDARRLPPELRWKIQGMVELFDFLNTDAAKAQMQGNSTAG